MGLLAVVAWLLYNLTFPAYARPIPGTPYVLRVQPGVPEADVAQVTASLRRADRHLTEHFGRTTTRRVNVQLSRFSPCIPFFPLRSTSTAIAAPNRICVNTRYNGWPTTRLNRPLAASLIAHEHFHTLQGQLGCLPKPVAREYAWWVEEARHTWGGGRSCTQA
ncbi:hypothetical protein ACFSC4_21460 [Deinococcus malanensis]|uniref:hypothetical protein n=1 Tax=Deinococcus malanensis TaxID=1706855 RepID=UPI0036250C3F